MKHNYLKHVSLCRVGQSYIYIFFINQDYSTPDENNCQISNLVPGINNSALKISNVVALDGIKFPACYCLSLLLPVGTFSASVCELVCIT